MTPTNQPSAQEVTVESKLSVDDAAEGAELGAAIAVDADVMAVAAPGADVGGGPGSGAVYVFLRDLASGQWVRHQHLMIAAGDPDDRLFELTLAVDGDTIVVGAPYTTLRDFQEGVVYIFERDAGGQGLWGEVARLFDVSVDHGGHFGSGVALEGDLLVVGAAQDGSARNGWVRIFERDRGGPDNWGRVTTLAHTSVGDSVHPKSFGSDVALQGDLLLIGASRTSLGFNTIDGAAYIFRRSVTEPDRWDHLGRLVRPGADDCTGGRPLSQFNLEASAEEIEAAAACAQENPVKSGSFGHRVAIDGDTLVVTALRATGDDGTYSVGEAYVYRRDPGGTDVWPYVTTLAPSAPSSGAYFGSALALEGDTVLVGAPGTTIGAMARQGAAYVFDRTAGGDAWGEVERLVASDGASEGQFGSAVALDGAAKIIGAKGDSTYRGALYIQVPPPAEGPPGPAFEPTGELLDDGVVEHAGGAVLGAVGTSLVEPLPVWIHEVESPATTLPPPAAPVGPFYNVGAVQTSAADDGTFALALPVPEAADTAHLAAAILVPGHRTLDGPGSGDFWLPVLGVYNPELRLFSITLRSLLTEGTTVVLIDHPGLAPLPSAATMRSRADDPVEPEWTFMVTCFPTGWTSPADCGPSDADEIASKLKTAYDDYTAMGYEKPALDSGLVETQRPDPDRPRKFEWVRVPTYRGIAIKSKDADPACVDTRGIYAPADGMMTICVGGGITDAELTKTVRHELFHAFQHSSEAELHDDWAGIDWSPAQNGEYKELSKVEDFAWISEGAAEAAEDSSSTMIRSQQQVLHPTSRALVASPKGPDDRDKIAYQAQDFWVHFGRTKELGLSYLKALFDRGGDPTAADRFLAEEHQTSLGAEYWAWVKNQAMEKTIDFDNWLQSPCTIETSLIGKTLDLLYPPGDAPASVSGRLSRLTSEVVRIVTVQEVGPITVSAVAADGGADHLRYKVYREGEQDCVAVDDGERTFQELPAAAFLHVVVSNLQHEAGRVLDYTVSVVPATD